MSTFKSYNPIVHAATAMVLILGVASASASPTYLLLEGNVYTSLRADGTFLTSLSQQCVSPPYRCDRDASVGQHISIRAVWDDATMFGGDADTSASSGVYGNTGYFLPQHYEYGAVSNGLAHYDLSDGGQITVNNTIAPNYTKEQIGGSSGIFSLGSYSGRSSTDAWEIALNTKKEMGSESVSLSMKASTTDQNNARVYDAFNIYLLSSGESLLDSQLFGFNWDSSKDGSASGEYVHDYARIVAVTSIMGVNWTRAVLSHNAADVQAIPLPASLWMMTSGVALLATIRKARKYC